LKDGIGIGILLHASHDVLKQRDQIIPLDFECFPSMSSVVDVVIIGAGLAGLRTADLLSECGLTVRVVEARSRVGGRTESVAAVDLGGQWVAAAHRRVHALCTRFDLPLAAQFDAGDSLLWLREGRVVRFRGHTPALHLHELVVLQLTLWRLGALARRVALVAPWRTHAAGLLDHVSVKDWLERYVPLDSVRQCVAVAVRSVFLEETHNVSLLWFLLELRGAGSLNALLDVKGGAQEFRLVDGAQSLSEKLLAVLASRRPLASVSFGSAVMRVSNYDGTTDGPVLVELASGEVVRARRVVGAISPQLTSKIAFVPACERQYLGEHGMFSGTCVKFHLRFKTAWWREQGLSGEVASNRPDVPVACVFDASTESGKSLAPALVGFVSSDTARSFVKQYVTADERRAAIEAAVHTLFAADAQTEKALEYRETSWCTEPFTDGCVNGTRPGGWLTRFRGVETGAPILERPGGSTELSRPVGNVIWAGAECGVEWNGYMEGALESAESAAKLVLEQLQATGTSSQLRLDGTELGELMKARRAPQLPPLGSAMATVYSVVDAADEWMPRLRYPMLGGIAASAFYGAGNERVALQVLALLALELVRLVLVACF
jgi:monoamine oxidase